MPFYVYSMIHFELIVWKGVRSVSKLTYGYSFVSASFIEDFLCSIVLPLLLSQCVVIKKKSVDSIYVVYFWALYFIL